MIFLTKMVKIIFFSQILTFIISKLYSVCFEKFFEVHYKSVCQKLRMMKFIQQLSHFWVSATSRLLLKRLCNSGGWSRAQMIGYDLICLENLSFGIFRAPELRYHGTVPRKSPHGIGLRSRQFLLSTLPNGSRSANESSYWSFSTFIAWRRIIYEWAYYCRLWNTVSHAQKST